MPIKTAATESDTRPPILEVSGIPEGSAGHHRPHRANRDGRHHPGRANCDLGTRAKAVTQGFLSCFLRRTVALLQHSHNFEQRHTGERIAWLRTRARISAGKAGREMAL